MMKIEIDGIQMGYDIWGHTAPPIVLIHGFGLDRSIWRDLAGAFLGDQQVLLPDMRGHGETDISPGTYTMDSLADDVCQLLEALGIQKAIVCGHSMGGYVALAFAQRHPHLLAGLGLITTNASADSEEKRGGRYALIDQVRGRGAIAVAEILAPRLSDDPAVIDQAHELICRTDPVGIIGALGGMAQRPDRSALLARIDVPALVVAGEADQITDLEDAKVMADALPQGQLLILPGVGHMPMFEASADLGQGLQSLVARVMKSS